MSSRFERAEPRYHIDVHLPEDEPARFIDAFVDALDLDALGFVRKRHFNGRDPFPPETLLKLFVFGWMERARSTRMLAKACKYDARYLFLARRDPPSRSTIERFWLDNYGRLEALFAELVGRAREAGLIGSQVQALDGTKLLAACSMHSALHQKGLKKANAA